MKKKMLSIAAVMSLVLALIAPAATAKASGGLEFYTDYPGISAKAGESESISMYVANDSGSAVEVDLSIASIPDGWEGYFTGNSTTISRVHVQDGEELGVTFQLQIPADASEGVYTIELQATSDTGLTDTVELVFDLQEVVYGAGSLSAEYADQEGTTGTSFSFDITLINNSASEQSYSLSANAPSGWQVSFTESGDTTKIASITVDSATSQGIEVTVTPTNNVEAGEYTIPISAVSANESLSTELSVTITGTYSLSLSTSNELLSFDAYVNKASDVTLSITNNSNVDLENITLTSSAPSGWTVSFDQSSIDTLTAGATQEITMHVTPSDTAMTGDYVTDITVSCNEASDTVEFRVSVKTETIWGIVAVLIILALIAGIAYIFKKYGRR